MDFLDILQFKGKYVSLSRTLYRHIHGFDGDCHMAMLVAVNRYVAKRAHQPISFELWDVEDLW